MDTGRVLLGPGRGGGLLHTVLAECLWDLEEGSQLDTDRMPLGPGRRGLIRYCQKASRTCKRGAYKTLTKSSRT